MDDSSSEYAAAGEAVIEEPRVAEEGTLGLVRVGVGGGGGGGGGGETTSDGWVLGGARGGAGDCANALMQNGAASFRCCASKSPSSSSSSSAFSLSSEEEREEEGKGILFHRKRRDKKYCAPVSLGGVDSLVSRGDEDLGVGEGEASIADVVGRSDQVRPGVFFGRRTTVASVNCDDYNHDDDDDDDGEEEEEEREGSSLRESKRRFGLESRSASCVSAGTASAAQGRDQSRSHRFRKMFPLLERCEGRKSRALPPKSPAEGGLTATTPCLAGCGGGLPENGASCMRTDNQTRRGETSTNSRRKDGGVVEVGSSPGSPCSSTPSSSALSSAPEEGSGGSASSASTSKSSDEEAWDGISCYGGGGGGRGRRGDQRLHPGLGGRGSAIIGQGPVLPWAYFGGSSNGDDGLMPASGSGVFNQARGEDLAGRRRPVLHARSGGQMGVGVGGRGSGGRISRTSGTRRGRGSRLVEAEARSDCATGEVRDGGGSATASAVPAAGGVRSSAEGAAGSRPSTAASPMASSSGGAVASWVQMFQWQTVGACRMDERLRPLLRWNLSCVGADGQLLADLGQHFRAKEMMMLVRCLLAPLVSLRAGRASKHGSRICPVNNRGYLSLIMLPCSELRLYFIADRGIVERVAVLTPGMESPSAELEMLRGDVSGRSFCIRLSSGRKLFFWNSEKSKAYGDDLISKLKDLIGHPPTLSQLTGIKDSRLEAFAAFVRMALLSSPNNNTNSNNSVRSSNNNSGGILNTTNLDLLRGSRLGDGLVREPVMDSAANANMPDSGRPATSEVDVSRSSSSETLVTSSFANACHLRTTGNRYSSSRTRSDHHSKQPHHAQTNQMHLGQCSNINSQISGSAPSLPRVSGLLSPPVSPTSGLPSSSGHAPSTSLPSRLWHVPSLPLQLSPHLSPPASQVASSYVRCKGPSSPPQRALCSLRDSAHQSQWQRQALPSHVPRPEDGGPEHDTKEKRRYLYDYYGSQGCVDQDSLGSVSPQQSRLQRARAQHGGGVPMLDQEKHRFLPFPLPLPRESANAGGAMTSQGFLAFGEERHQHAVRQVGPPQDAVAEGRVSLCTEGGRYRNLFGRHEVACGYARDLTSGMAHAESSCEGPNWTEFLSPARCDSEGNPHGREIGVPLGGNSRPWAVPGSCLERQVPGNRLFWAGSGSEVGRGWQRTDRYVGGEGGLAGSCCICGGGHGMPMVSLQGNVSALPSADPVCYSPTAKAISRGDHKRDLCADCSTLVAKVIDRADSSGQSGGSLDRSNYLYRTAKGEGRVEACHRSSWDVQSSYDVVDEPVMIGTTGASSGSLGNGSCQQARNSDASRHKMTTASDAMDASLRESTRLPFWHASGVSYRISGSVFLGRSTPSEPRAPAPVTFHHQPVSDVPKMSGPGLQQNGLCEGISVVGLRNRSSPPACLPILPSGCAVPPRPPPIGLPIGPSTISSVAPGARIPPPLASLFPAPSFETPPAPWFGSLIVGSPSGQCTSLGWQHPSWQHSAPVQKQHSQTPVSFMRMPQLPSSTVSPTKERLPLSSSFFSLPASPSPLVGPSSPVRAIGSIPLPGQSQMPSRAEQQHNIRVHSGDSNPADADQGINPCHGSRLSSLLPRQQFATYLSLPSLPSLARSMSSNSPGIVPCHTPGLITSSRLETGNDVQSSSDKVGLPNNRDSWMPDAFVLGASHQHSAQPNHVRSLSVSGLACLGDPCAVQNGRSRGDAAAVPSLETIDFSQNDSFAESRLRRWLGLDNLAMTGNDSVVGGQHARTQLLPANPMQAEGNGAGMFSREGVGPLAADYGMASWQDSALLQRSGGLADGMEASRGAEIVVGRAAELPHRTYFSRDADTVVNVEPLKLSAMDENGTQLGRGHCGRQVAGSTACLLRRARANETLSPLPSLLQDVRAPIRGRLTTHIQRMTTPPSIYRTREKEAPSGSAPSVTNPSCGSFQPFIACHIAPPDGSSVTVQEGTPVPLRDVGPVSEVPDVQMSDMDGVNHLD